MTFATETGVTPQKPTGKAIQNFQGAKPAGFALNLGLSLTDSD